MDYIIIFSRNMESMKNRVYEDIAFDRQNLRLRVLLFLLGSIICEMSEIPQNKTLRVFLTETIPEYIEDVPQHWLEQESPFYCIQVLVAIVFLLICIPGNIGQTLVFIAYSRYLLKQRYNPNSFNNNSWLLKWDHL